MTTDNTPWPTPEGGQAKAYCAKGVGPEQPCVQLFKVCDTQMLFGPELDAIGADHSVLLHFNTESHWTKTILQASDGRTVLAHEDRDEDVFLAGEAFDDERFYMTAREYYCPMLLYACGVSGQVLWAATCPSAVVTPVHDRGIAITLNEYPESTIMAVSYTHLRAHET